jgi:chromosome segregation ATPase
LGNNGDSKDGGDMSGVISLI